MKRQLSVLTTFLLALVAASAQAAVINVTSESLYMNSEVTLEYLSGETQTFRDSYLGSLFSGDREVIGYDDEHFIPVGQDRYDHVFVDMNAQFEVDEGVAKTTYWMDVETDVYAVDQISNPDPTKIIASAFDYESLIAISMEFLVDGDGAEVSFEINNEGVFAPTSFILDDLTTSTRIASTYSEFRTEPAAAFANLVDGHRYALNLMVSEQDHDDDDMSARLVFENADLVRAVAEPAISLLFATGLAALGVAGRSRHRAGKGSEASP